MKKGDEYELSGDYVTIWGFVQDDNDRVIVLNGGDYGELLVVHKSELHKKEESYRWKQEVKRKEELEAIAKQAEANLQKVADKVVDKALKALASRIKFNSIFGDGGNLAWAGLVIKELEGMIKEKPVEKLKDKGIFD